MKTKVIIISIFLGCFLTHISGQNPFYYSFDGQKIYFKQLDSVVFIKFKDDLTIQNRETVKQSYLLEEINHPSQNDKNSISQLFKINRPDKIMDLKNLGNYLAGFIR